MRRWGGCQWGPCRTRGASDVPRGGGGARQPGRLRHWVRHTCWGGGSARQLQLASGWTKYNSTRIQNIWARLQSGWSRPMYFVAGARQAPCFPHSDYFAFLSMVKLLQSNCRPGLQGWPVVFTASAANSIDFTQQGWRVALPPTVGLKQYTNRIIWRQNKLNKQIFILFARLGNRYALQSIIGIIKKKL